MEITMPKQRNNPTKYVQNGNIFFPRKQMKCGGKEIMFRKFRPPMPFGPPMFKELNQLIFLWTISEETEGMTGYQLQKSYNISQTSVYRTLKEMEDEGYLEVKETIEKGRANKSYKITEKGRERISNLRENWGSQIAFLSDIVPPERTIFSHMGRRHHHKHPGPFSKALKNIKSKEDALNFARVMNERMKRTKSRLQHRLEGIESLQDKIDDTIKDMEESEETDSKKLIETINNLFK